MKHLKLLLLTVFVALSANVTAQSVKIKWKQIQTGTNGQVAIVGVDGLGHWVVPPFLNIADTAGMLAAYQTQINARVKYTDTAAMLAAYQLAINNANTAINLRVKYTDTAAMLAAYATAINARVKYSDTAAMLANYGTAINNRVKYTDTAAMLSPYERVSNKASDLSTSNNTLYPTTKAAKDNDISAISVTGTTTKTITATRPNGNITTTFTDDNTTYTNGYGLNMVGTTISVDTTRIVPLDAGGKISFNYLPATLMVYKGVWNVATNTPTLVDGTGTTGWVYKITGAATSGTVRNLGSGNITFYNGDWAIYNGTAWERSNNSDLVTSVNGYQGVVTLITTDIPEGTRLYYTDARARQAINAGSGITYNNTTGQVTNAAPNVQSNLTLGTVTATTQPINNSDGTGVTLPSATTTTAGLMSAADKTAITNLDGNYIKQNGNSFGTAMIIGTNDNNTVNFKVNNITSVGVAAGGIVTGTAFNNSSGVNNASVGASSTGTIISRNIADANVALTVNQISATSTGNIQSWQFASSAKAAVNKDGYGLFQRLGINSGLTTPSYLLDVNAGVLATSNPLAQFGQNGGYLSLYSVVSTANTFTPTIKSVSVGTGNQWGFGVLAFGSNSYSQGAVTFRVYDSTGTGAAIAGNLLAVQNATSTKLSVDYNGTTTISSLANAASGIVTVNTSGALGRTTTVPVSNGGTGVATLTGYVKGNGTSAFTASATIPFSDLTGVPVVVGLIQTAEQFSGSTSNSITLGHVPSSAAHLSVSLNGQWLTASDFGATSSTLTLSNVSRETDDVILVYYSY